MSKKTTRPKPAGPQEEAREQRPRARRTRGVGRFIVVFCVLCVLASLAEWQLGKWSACQGYYKSIASAVGRISNGIGIKTVARDTTVSAGGFSLLIVGDCAAFFATGVFWAGVMAFPATWARRVVGLLMGMVGVPLLNVIRIALLVVFAAKAREYFHFAHDVLMQGFLILFVVPLWALWATWASRTRQPVSGPPATP